MKHGVVMDVCSKVEAYGRKVLEAAEKQHEYDSLELEASQ